MQTKIPVLIGSLLFPLIAGAWGALGHRTTGLIAQDRLTPQGSAWVKNLLRNESLADVASWADNVRSKGTYKATTWYHFEKISDGVAFRDHVQNLPDWQKAKGGIITALIVAQETLRDGSRSASERADALKFLVHFVGDLHQPLHTGRPEDNGGSKIRLDWQGRPTTLHHIWDTSMIETGHADIMEAYNPIEPMVSLTNSSRQYAEWLTKHFDANNFETREDLETWLNESLALRAAAYEKGYLDNQDKYLKTHLPTVDERVFVAGIRLGRMVNELAAQAPASDLENILRRDLEKILGSLEQLINLRP